MNNIAGLFYILYKLLHNIFVYLYENFSSFIVNVSSSVILSVIFICIINQNEKGGVLGLKHETLNKITQIQKLKEPSDQVSYEMSLKYQSDYEFNPLNPILTVPKPGQTLTYRLGQGGYMLSTVVPNDSTAIFENI